MRLSTEDPSAPSRLSPKAVHQALQSYLFGTRHEASMELFEPIDTRKRGFQKQPFRGSKAFQSFRDVSCAFEIVEPESDVPPQECQHKTDFSLDNHLLVLSGRLVAGHYAQSKCHEPFR